MKTVSVESALANIYGYLNNNLATPFIVVVDDSTEYLDVMNGLSTLAPIRASDYCAGDDVFPDIDALYTDLSAITENKMLLGLGESIALGGRENVIGKLKDLPLMTKVVVLCRGIRSTMNSLCLEDKKLNSRRACFLKSGASYEVVKFPTSFNVSAIDGFKSLLVRLENGAGGALFVKTNLPLCNIKRICSAYEAIQQAEPAFIVSRSCLPDTLWEEYLANKNLEGYGLFHWRNFLKLKLESTTNIYLKYVTNTSTDYDMYKKQLLCALLDFEINDKQFPELYSARKILLKDIKDNDVAEYISETKVKDNNRVYYLTDNTAAERKAIIETMDGLVTITGMLKEIYPSLHEYLHDYSFTGNKGKLLSDYFAEYKRLKLTNRITPEFYCQVRKMAVDGGRPYNSLKTRGEVLDRLEKSNSTLYWVDALGAEYLGYIQSRAKTLGLKITIHIVRANLPTITSFNSDFYEVWCGDKAQTKKLDEVKHGGEHDFNYQTVKTPVYLAEELRIVDDALDWVKIRLAGRSTEKVILVSDHGASRLAVINEQECRWEMESRGEHSGRCCPCSDVDIKSKYATKENGFWVLANYDRFRGGRKASVEVHGGATLEEVVIPIIEITLFDSKIEVKNTTPVTTASFKKNAEIVLFSKNILEGVSVKVFGRQYLAEAVGNNKHKIVFPDIKRAGKYTADVLEGDNLIGQVEFEVHRESGKVVDMDWF